MDRSLKWRTFFLIAITVLSFMMLMPTVFSSADLPPWFSRTFNRKIQLGLDIQGGLHIVYSIDLNKAVDDKATEIKRELEAKLTDSKVKGKVTTPIHPIGAVDVVLDNPKDKAQVEGDFLKPFDEIVVKRTCDARAKADRTVCIRVSSDYAEGIKKAALEQAVRTVRERIDERGVAEPDVVTKGDQIIVELPGLDSDSIKRVKDIIQRTAKLEFKIVEDGSPFMQKIYARAYKDVQKDHPGKTDAEIRKQNLTTEPEGIGVGIDRWTHDKTGKSFVDWFLTAKDRDETFTIPQARKRGCYRKDKAEVAPGKVRCTVSGREVIQRYLDKLAAETVKDAKTGKDTHPYQIDGDHAWGFQLERPERTATGEPVWRTYYLRHDVELTGSSVANAYVYWNSTTNRPEVLLEFDRWGANRFEDLTGKNVGKKMAIILDDKVSSAPVLQDRISGGRSSITMGGGGNPQQIQREAQDLVNVLKTGSLPAPLRVDTESEVGPLLGLDAVQKAKVSFLLGCVLVVLVMLFFYRFSGILAIGCVTLNVLFMLALMAGFGATLTLPGIAAVVLTVGMAVDANIIIYERMREELRLGKSVKGAVDAGFHRAFAAILDGQLTTAAAGLVLYQYGSGPIKGFAVMLLIGIFTTLFTQVWCARLFFDYYIGRRRQANKISI